MLLALVTISYGIGQLHANVSDDWRIIKMEMVAPTFGGRLQRTRIRATIELKADNASEEEAHAELSRAATSQGFDGKRMEDGAHVAQDVDGMGDHTERQQQGQTISAFDLPPEDLPEDELSATGRSRLPDDIKAAIRVMAGEPYTTTTLPEMRRRLASS